MRKWKLTCPIAKPPNANGLPSPIPYIHQYALDMAYVTPPGPCKSMKAFKKRFSGVLLMMLTTSNDLSELRIVRKYPALPWQRVWATLHTAGLSDTIKSTWYAAIRDILPTNERLAAINLATTTTCSRCGTSDTLQHRITECEEGAVIWNWTRARTAAILRVDNKYISEEWTLCPIFQFRPPQRHAAIVWMIDHLVVYRLQNQRRLSLTDYMDFLYRARGKGNHRKPRRSAVGRYVDVL
jgi:hypothetical protein